MTSHKTGTREEWLAARLELLEAEKELTRRSDELARQRQELPWVRVDKDYRFETDDGHGVARRPVPRALAAAHLPLHVRARLHRGLPVLLGDRRRLQRLRGPPRQPRRHALRGIAGSARQAARRTSGGWAGASRGRPRYGSDFNFDFGVAHTKEEWEAGATRYNFRRGGPAAGRRSRSSSTPSPRSIVGTDWQTYRREGPGMSAFALQDGAVYHAYSAYARGLDALWGMYQWLDRAPLRP